MGSFGHLLRDHIIRNGWSNVQFAKRVGVTDTSISNATRDQSTPRLSRAPDWIKVLGLSGDDAREFMLAWELACSPRSVQRMVEQLRRRVAELEQRHVADGDGPKPRPRLKP